MPHRKLNMLLLAFATYVSYHNLADHHEVGWFLLSVLSTACTASTIIAFVLAKPMTKPTELAAKAAVRKMEGIVANMEASRAELDKVRDELAKQVAVLLNEDKERLLYGYLKEKFEHGISESAAAMAEELVN